MEMSSDQHDMRNKLLADLVMQMHERMADKLYPDDTHSDEEANSAGLKAHDDSTMPMEHQDKLIDGGKAMKMAMGGMVPEMPLSTEPGQVMKGERLPDLTTPPTGSIPTSDPDDEAKPETEEDDDLLELMRQQGV